ncbi:MAG: bifunctional oligoribonuclease/PAP phosphatase NrnA [Bulleidia sp.]|nr:bifunctional oligoribonuclease/PAP phosphatase NrnA [Bulleidia sp.]
MEFKGLEEEIAAHPVITIFRHEHPDCDAMGSQAALDQWIRENYRDKEVYRLGAETCTQGKWEAMDQVSDDLVRNSLAIVLDTANKERVDDQRYVQAQKVIKIDHHPERDPFGSVNYVFEKAAATCEILATFFEQQKKSVSQKTAEALYCGLLTDTLCFRTNNTTSHTLAAASWVAQYDVRIPELNRMLFDQDLKAFRFAGWIRSHVQTRNDALAYLIIDEDVQKEWGYTGSEARNFIDEIGHVQEFQVWALFTQKTVEGKVLYDGSLRSKTVQVNDLAQQYGGGGHYNAAGVKNLSEESLKTLLQSLFSRI